MPAKQVQLGAVRLSREQDESTSVERQREQIEAWARSKGYEVTVWATDTDVSGKVSPFDRDGLGPYLRPPLLHSWDVLVCAKLDRLTRNVVDWAELAEWATDEHEQLVSVAESLDLTTAMGRGMGT